MRTRTTVALAALALLAGAAIGAHAQGASDAHADITVLPCSAYATTSTPVTPAYTFIGACALPDGTLSTPNK